ncbi:TPA: methyltransferase domain-containing protein [Candidatus Micrarchaeota archaeon]|nr:methyltransferase domain-containing protein [Candidatus Micrarchaeota archaeon]
MIPFFDWKKFKRGPQVVLHKDAGMLLGFAGIGEGDRVAEAGSGSGWLTVFLANVVGVKGKVYSYEKREEFLAIAKKNIDKAGFTERVEFKLKDAAEGFEEKDLDCIVLDCGDSNLLLSGAFQSLKSRGLCVGFIPNTEQVRDFVLEGEKQGFEHLMTVEGIVREWLVRERGTRPKNVGLTHTTFQVFLRKP